MARAGLRGIIFGLSATGLLMGCVEGGGQEGAGGATFAASPRKAAATRDVEAPEVYQTSDKALWDGRPSLGGIWVAAPNVTNPERAIIVNTANGKSVTGALFKRERDNPGPRLQLSSDAAEALGILAGQPTEIRVTALKKEEVKQPDAPVVAAAAAPDPAAKPAATAAKSADTGEAAAIASAALTAVEAGKTSEPAKTGESAPDADPAAAASQPAKPKTWKERRAEAKAEREAKRRAAAEAKAAAAAAKAAAATTATAAGDPADPSQAPTATPAAAAAAVAPIESAPLDARKPDATKPAAAAAKPAKPATEAPAKAAATPAPAATAAGATAPAVAGASRPIQVASFSKEENATRATEALAKIGITATPQKSERDGKPVWGVVVQGDDAMLKKIKAAGFADAYYLK